MKRKLQQEYEIYLPSLGKTVDFSVEEPVDASRYFATTMLWIAIVAAICDIIYQVTNWAISLH